MTSRRLPLALTTLFAGTALVAFVAPAEAQSSEVIPATHDAPVVVEVTAEDFAFRVPEKLPSGWVTLRFENAGEEHHFLVFGRLPQGRTYDDYVTEIGMPFNEVWYQLRDGEIGQDEAWELLGASVPEWIGDIRFMGGSGLVAPGKSTEVTVHLTPGNYVVECYMKSADGEIHWMEGMSDPVTVTEESSGGSPPDADVRLAISNDGIDVDGELTPGRRTFEVYVADQGAVFGHNLHLARLDEETEADDVLGWENWMTTEGMQAPAPAIFAGGVHLLPVGERRYFTTDLEAGRYLLISESGIWKEIAVRP